jgi:hypothetical protein
MKTSQLLFLVAAFLTSSAFATQEKWYLGFGLGPSVTSYKATKAGRESKHLVGLGFDLQFYFPMSADGKTVIGPTLTGATNGESRDDQRSNFAVNGSILHSFGKEPGDGFFLRGDFGIGGVKFGSEDSTAGYAVLADFGYGWAFSEQTRIIAQVRYELVLTRRHSAHGFAFAFGPMF